MRIGVDIDGVMYKWEEVARFMLFDVLPDSPYKRSGPLGLGNLHYNYIKECLKPEHWHWLWTEGVERGLFRHGHMYPGTVEALNELAAMGDITIITTRPKNAIHDTLAWLAFHKFPITNMHMVPHGMPKSSILPHCDVYIDDHTENVIDLYYNTPGQVCIMDQLWNRTPIALLDPAARDGIYRVSSWQAFIEVVQHVKRKRKP